MLRPKPLHGTLNTNPAPALSRPSILSARCSTRSIGEGRIQTCSSERVSGLGLKAVSTNMDRKMYKFPQTSLQARKGPTETAVLQKVKNPFACFFTGEQLSMYNASITS